MRFRGITIPLSAPFTITGYTFTEMTVVIARVSERGAAGEGEAAGVYYLDDDADRMCAAIEDVRRDIEAGIDRESLRRLLPPGGARNALDCALWDLEAKRCGSRSGASQDSSVRVRCSRPSRFRANDPATMAAKAVEYAQAKSLKLKLTGELPLDAERVRAVRRARPDAWLGVDANQGFNATSLTSLMPDLVACKVKLVEQPFARGREADLDGFRCPIPVAADESVQGLADIEPLVGRFDIVNIKLDKCGGLTEGLAMAAEARRLGLGVMVGNMVGTSLAMAPAWILGQLCDINDLDGTLFISRDRKPAMAFENGKVSYPDRGWGAAA